MSFLRRRESSSSGNGNSLAYVGSAAESKRLPALCEFLAALTWPDGLPRVSGSLTVFAEDGRLKVWLSDRDQGLGGVVTVQSLESLLLDVEAALAKDSVQWRVPKDRKTRK